MEVTQNIVNKRLVYNCVTATDRLHRYLLSTKYAPCIVILVIQLYFSGKQTCRQHLKHLSMKKVKLFIGQLDTRHELDLVHPHNQHYSHDQTTDHFHHRTMFSEHNLSCRLHQVDRPTSCSKKALDDCPATSRIPHGRSQRGRSSKPHPDWWSCLETPLLLVRGTQPSVRHGSSSTE